MTERSDAELVSAHLAGDRGALAAIYDRYADSLYDTAAAMLGDRHDAEDLAHDVFVVACRSVSQPPGPAQHQFHRQRQHIVGRGVGQPVAPPEAGCVDPKVGRGGGDRGRGLHQRHRHGQRRAAVDHGVLAQQNGLARGRGRGGAQGGHAYRLR